MKKILFAIALVLTISLTANAQGQGRNDAFVYDWSNDWDDGRDPVINLLLPIGILGGQLDEPGAPLGSGLLILTALGAGYAVYRKKNK